MPRLHMRRTDLDELSSPDLPDGYLLSEYSPGDEAGIADLLQTTLGEVWTSERALHGLINPGDVKATFAIVFSAK